MKEYYCYESYPQIFDEMGEGKGLARRLKVSHRDTFDLVPATMEGLFEDLVPGSELMDVFMAEWEKFQKTETNYGVWVFYPRKKHLVRFAPPFWHRLALLVRNSTLLRDPELKLTWAEIRGLFEKTVVAVAGCSVGNNSAHAVASDLRPLHIKVADYKDFSMTNANRVRLTYADFGRNKAVVTAEQLHAVDPFMRVSVFSEGIHEGNVSDFVVGREDVSEPRSSFIIEETDDPDAKIFIREEARRHRIPVVMVTDMGSAVQLDIRRFDLDANLPLAACSVSDDELYTKRNRWQEDLADRNKFFEFAFTLIGQKHLRVPEFKRIILKEDKSLFGGIPQLGSTAMMAGGMASEAIARIILGFRLPERMFINKHTGETIVEGERHG